MDCSEVANRTSLFQQYETANEIIFEVTIFSFFWVFKIVSDQGQVKAFVLEHLNVLKSYSRTISRAQILWFRNFNPKLVFLIQDRIFAKSRIRSGSKSSKFIAISDQLKNPLTTNFDKKKFRISPKVRCKCRRIFGGLNRIERVLADGWSIIIHSETIRITLDI